MARRSVDTAEVAYVGFLLGHGGDALQMLDLAHGVKQRGLRVRIIVPAVPSSVTFQQRSDALGIPCERSPLISASMAGARQSFWSLHSVLRSIEAPIVHFHTGNTYLPRSVMLMLELLRYRKAFVTLQSPYETMAPGSLRARVWSVLARRRFAAVASPSGHATDFQLRCGLRRDLAVTVRNSIDVDAMACGDPSGPRAAVGLGPHDPLVLFCSRIDAQKRPVEAVQIFAGIANEFPSAKLVFAGQGDERDSVINESARLGIRDRVQMVGYQTDIANWLAAATVWLLPTERENFSVAVLEALAAGCPMVSTSCQGNDEVLTDGVNALTFPVGDVPTATAHLRRVLSDAALREQLRKGARASARQYSVDNMVEAYCRIYRRAECVPPLLRAD